VKVCSPLNSQIENCNCFHQQQQKQTFLYSEVSSDKLEMKPNTVATKETVEKKKTSNSNRSSGMYIYYL